jgi:hypothetical protein
VLGAVAAWFGGGIGSPRQATAASTTGGAV